MVTVLNLGSGGGGSSTLKTILLIATIAGAGYLAYKYFIEGKAADTTTNGGGGGIVTTADIVGNTAGALGTAAISGGSGLDIPTTNDSNIDWWSNLTENLWNFSTGILKVNPLTAPAAKILDFATSGINQFLADKTQAPTTETAAPLIDGSISPSIKAKTINLKPTEYTTPTIPKYTTDYEAEIKASAAPAIVKSKILAGKIT